MNGLEYYKMLMYGRRLGKTNMVNEYLSYTSIIFKKTFKNRKLIELHYYNEQIQLLIYDRNRTLSHKKHSLRLILKYLKKNLTPEELLEAEQQIFECI